MEELATRFSNFFRERMKSHPEVLQPGKLPGAGEVLRVSAFTSVRKENIERQKGSVKAELKAPVYSISSDSHLTSIIAVYPDETLLWLDDHSSDVDFSIFLVRENLVDWLPHRLEQWASLVTNTKFNYLGEPQFIGSPYDIPPIRERSKTVLREMPGGADEIIEWEQRLVRIADQIKPPVVTIASGEYFVDFFIWTRVYGRVIRLQCQFSREGSFRYEATDLAGLVGDYFAPR
jgi:hypothetical protein